MLTGRAPSPTEAFRCLTNEEDGAAIRRLQRRWQRDGQGFIDGYIDSLTTSRWAWEEKNLAEEAPALLEQLKQFETSPGGIELLAGLARTPATRNTHDFMTFWRLRETTCPGWKRASGRRVRKGLCTIVAVRDAPR